MDSGRAREGGFRHAFSEPVVSAAAGHETAGATNTASSESLTVPKSGRWQLLASSERLLAAWRASDGVVRVPGALLDQLGLALDACWIAGVRQSTEIDVIAGLGAGAWRVECVPWNLTAELRVALLVLTCDTEAALLRRRIEQVNRSESLGLLAGSIAHDFNNLLTGIRGSLALVRHHTSPEGRANALAAADLAAQRAGEMTRRLLTFSRGPERVQRRAEPFRVLQETVDLMRCMPDTSRVDIELDPELGLVEMLPSELHQVVLNLLVNASDAVRGMGGAESVMLRASTTWRTDAGGTRGSRRWLRVSVIDQGPGMDANVRRRIFEPFFTTKALDRGTGLGLCSVKDLVERAGGWLEVESEVARGSAFHVYLPLTAEPEVAPPASREVVRARQRVLICDDEGRLADLTVGLLEEFGFSAQAVVRGEEAVAVLSNPQNAQRAKVGGEVAPSETELPRVLLLDVNLAGGMPAQEVLDTLQQREVAVRVILSSGLSAEDVPVSLRQHPLVVTYLAKPYTVDSLVLAINNALV
jgi:signal transduction histidine kinase/CheY-like chemotaxis protein